MSRGEAVSGDFTESLDLVAPRIAPCLATGEQLGALSALATHLPPLHRGGFEYRLGAGPGLDLQQAVDTTAAARARFHQFAERDGGQCAGLLGRIDELLALWFPDASGQPTWLERLWLEFDTTRSRQPAPSVFLTLKGQRVPPKMLVRQADRVFDRLAGTMLQRVPRRSLERACRPGPDYAPISDLGCMASRERRALRLVVPCRSTRGVLARLRALDWPGPQSPVRQWCERLFERSKELRVCVDVADRVLPWIGLEVPVNADSGDDPVALELFGLLQREGLCDPEERAALLRWPGIVTPQDAPGPWPEALVAASIAGSPDALTALRCRFSHLKVSLEGRDDPVVKAYFGYFGFWLSPRTGA